MGKRAKRSLAALSRQPNNYSELILNHASIEQEYEDIERTEQSSPCFLDDFPRRSRRRAHRKNAFVMSKMKLDTDLFEQYSGKLWETFSEGERAPFTCLDSLWFPLYLKKSFKLKVLSWIKKERIFSKKYVFVPMVRWDHWSLLILCHFGESLHSNATSTPCMLLLDSLHSMGPDRLQPDIRKFIKDIYAVEGRPVTRRQINRIPLLIPNVPQQRDDMECGKFVIYYMKLFMEDAPKNFSISDGYPYCMNQSWFSEEDPQRFLEKLESVTDEPPTRSPSAKAHMSPVTPYAPARNQLTAKRPFEKLESITSGTPVISSARRRARLSPKSLTNGPSNLAKGSQSAAPAAAHGPTEAKLRPKRIVQIPARYR